MQTRQLAWPYQYNLEREDTAQHANKAASMALQYNPEPEVEDGLAMPFPPLF
ncbi:hypothetical protein EJ02DRAFT_428681 [Clathrospora elynae]|uniref:Uncharacterized protein n=1 Tax=Clathrospora elynae TaxID=706981 RepID=A0A6A5S3E3_9PLEO|nr:hypothetical protein EJ02DRAFT_428681 [Clathrospora elynae]